MNPLQPAAIPAPPTWPECRRPHPLLQHRRRFHLKSADPLAINFGSAAVRGGADGTAALRPGSPGTCAAALRVARVAHAGQSQSTGRDWCALRIRRPYSSSLSKHSRAHTRLDVTWSRPFSSVLQALLVPWLSECRRTVRVADCQRSHCCDAAVATVQG